MPTYTCQCKKCGKQADYIRSVDNREKSPRCECGSKTVKIISAAAISPMTFTGHKAFQMPDGKGGSYLGTWIEDGAAYKRYLKENNVIPESEGRREAEIKAAGIKAEDNAKLRKVVEKAVIQHTNK